MRNLHQKGLSKIVEQNATSLGKGHYVRYIPHHYNYTLKTFVTILAMKLGIQVAERVEHRASNLKVPVLTVSCSG